MPRKRRVLEPIWKVSFLKFLFLNLQKNLSTFQRFNPPPLSFPEDWTKLINPQRSARPTFAAVEVRSTVGGAHPYHENERAKLRETLEARSLLIMTDNDDVVIATDMPGISSTPRQRPRPDLRSNNGPLFPIPRAAASTLRVLLSELSGSAIPIVIRRTWWRVVNPHRPGSQLSKAGQKTKNEIKRYLYLPVIFWFVFCSIVFFIITAFQYYTKIKISFGDSWHYAKYSK